MDRPPKRRKMAMSGHNPTVISGTQSLNLPTFSGKVVKDDINPSNFVEWIETCCKAVGRDANEMSERHSKRMATSSHNPKVISGQDANDVCMVMYLTRRSNATNWWRSWKRRRIKEPFRIDVLKRATSSLAEASKSEFIHKEQNKIFYFEEKSNIQNPNELDLEDEEIAVINQRRIKAGHNVNHCNTSTKWTRKAIKDHSQEKQMESDSSDQVLSFVFDKDLEKDLITKIHSHPFHDEIVDLFVKATIKVKLTKCCMILATVSFV
jgi:hypothetical protein